MRMTKKVIIWSLVFSMLISILAPTAYAAESNDESIITNGYITYSFNKATGGFSINTVTGNPRKVLDDNIPLLYSEDKERSNGTSFVTVRIDGRDFIFGREYGFFGIDSELKKPVISEEGRLMTTEWTIKNITVIQKIAIGTDMNSNTIGNAGMSFEVKNNSGSPADIGIRLLLDTALGNKIDAPYVIAGENLSPTYVETEFSGDDVPSQIRNVDSVSTPQIISYIMPVGFTENTAKPSKVIVGHWANLANTRYNYSVDQYCDFTNYSNSFRTPDSAAAIYWEKDDLENGKSFLAEALYGVGNFSQNEGDKTIGLNVAVNRVELNDDKKSYKNDGIIEVDVDIDNSLDNSTNLTSVLLSLNVNDEDFELIANEQYSTTFTQIAAGELKTATFKLKAKPQSEITAGEIYVTVTGTRTLSDESEITVENMTERSVILPSVKSKYATIQMHEISPKIVWTGAEKAVTITGDMSEFSTLSVKSGWDLRLKHTTSNHEVLIAKKDISFLDKNYTNMSFTTEEELEVGYYDIVFEFTDSLLIEAFGKSVTASAQLQVSADEKYRLKSYGIISLVRSTVGNKSDYDFFMFENEGEYLKFYDGEKEKIGGINGTQLQYDFGKDIDAAMQHEILLTVRGNLREMEKNDGGKKKKYWQADYADGDIIINNILSYEGNKPLEMYEENGKYVVEGDGLLKVVNSVNVWRSEWSFAVWEGTNVTLDNTRVKQIAGGASRLRLSLDGAAVMVQSLGGFLIDMKYGEMSSTWYDDADGRVTYGISFGGQIGLPIKSDKDAASASTSLPGTGGTSGGSSGGTSGGSSGGTSGGSSGGTSGGSSGGTSGGSSGGTSGGSSGGTSGSSGGTSGSSGGTSGGSSGGTSGSSGGTSGSSGGTTSSGHTVKKQTGLTDAQISAAVNNVMFGEEGEIKNKRVVVDGVGFIGIDASVSFGLPKDLLGALVNNAPGLYVSMTINTIDNIYEFGAGLNLKLIECEGLLAFKEVRVKNKDVIVPDKIEFYIREGLAIPVVPGLLFITGLGGGINGLADTIGGNFSSLPPITIIMAMRLKAIGLLTGDFEARVSLEGLSLKGSLTINNLEELLLIEAGISARWINPWSLNLYGNVDIIDGIIKGGLSITIADDYFYGYIYAMLCIPDSVPIVGGIELAGVEAAVSNEFVGANIEVLGLKYGVIYYWGGDVSFDKNIDLSAPAAPMGATNTRKATPYVVRTAESNVTSYYGTNTSVLGVGNVSLKVPTLRAANTISSVETRLTVPAGQHALLFEVPYIGTGKPNADNIYLVDPNKEEIKLIAADDEGNGSLLVQDRGADGKYIYISVTDSSRIKSGTWAVCCRTSDIVLKSVNGYGVDDVPELDKSSVTAAHAAKNSFDVDVAWDVSNSRTGKIADFDVYFTKDPNALEKIKTSNNSGSILGDSMAHFEDRPIKAGSEKITIPETYESGTYYAVLTMSTTDGISCAISQNSFDFVNDNLPNDIDAVTVEYAGNGNLRAVIDDADTIDYTHYLVEITSADGTALNNNLNMYEVGDTNINIGAEAGLVPDNKYIINVRTLREENVPGSGSTDATIKYF